MQNKDRQFVILSVATMLFFIVAIWWDISHLRAEATEMNDKIKGVIQSGTAPVQEVEIERQGAQENDEDFTNRYKHEFSSKGGKTKTGGGEGGRQ